jgi:hypothetical protein
MPSLAARVRRAVTDWFAAETHPVNLAVVRITVFWILFEVLRTGSYRRDARMPADLRFPPPGWDPILEAIPVTVASITALQIAAAVFALLALVGLWTRPAALLATLLGCFVLVTPYLFGKVDHNLHHIIWFGLLLASSPSGDALSFDAWLARRRGQPPPGPARAYALPIRMMWLLMGVSYFSAGFYKLLALPEWVTSDHFKFLLYESWWARHALPVLRIDRHPLLLQALAAGTIVFEISFLFLVIARRTRPLAALAGLVFHAATAYFLRIYFVALALCYVVFVDWHALAQRLGWTRALKAPAPPGVRAAPSAAAAAAVGGLLIALQIGFGALRIDSWPFAVFPRFDRIRSEPARSKLEAMLESGSGSRRLKLPVRTTSLGRILDLPEGEERERHLRALTSAVVARHGALQPGERLRIYSSFYSTLPEDRRAPPLRRELVFDYHAGADDHTRAQP